MSWMHSGVFECAGWAMAASWSMALVSGLAQGGLAFAPTALLPTASRISPASRVGQMFSVAGLGRLLKSLLPAGAIVWLAVVIGRREWLRLPELLGGSARGVLGFALGGVFELAWKASLVMLAWAVVDYFIERQRVEQDLRMSRQELKDEMKESEGHPLIKQKIRRLQRQVRRRRMLKDAERAAVVITNPTQFAIALEYRMDMNAPVVVAKGRSHLAAQIKEVARWRGIPIVENPPLAHALYRAAEIGQAIPPKLYAVVAEILAAIWRVEARAEAAASQAGVNRDAGIRNWHRRQRQ